MAIPVPRYLILEEEYLDQWYFEGFTYEKPMSYTKKKLYELISYSFKEIEIEKKEVK